MHAKMRHHSISTQTFKIITQYGDMLVVKQGVLHKQHSSNHQNHHHHHAQHSTNAPHHQHHHGGSSSGGGGGDTQGGSRPILMTFHDLGMNSELQFANFCERDEVKLMLQTFTIIHVNFIGQEFNGQGQPVSALPDDYKYPTVEQMAECIVDVCAQLRVRSFIGLAVGAGAHIVSTLALMRPDLVHGLFLINPVISSCSITEWLYFKMSAIASNHQILGGNHGGGGGGGSGAGSNTVLGTGSSVASSFSEDQSSAAAEDHHAHSHSSSGFRKLWKAVNHNHHHHHHQRHHSSGKSSSESTHGSVAGCESPGESESGSPTPSSLSQTPSRTSGPNQSSPPPPPPAPGKPAAAASSRLRQLILSRNFRLGKQQQRPASATTHEERCDDSTSRQESPSSSQDRQRRSSVGSQASSSASSQLAYSGKRPPLEYLTYHHFGTASLQRFRRMSSDMQATSIAGSARAGGVHTPSRTKTADAADSSSELQSELLLAQQGQHRDSCDSNASGQSARFAASAAARQHRGSRGTTTGGDNDSQRSQDSLSRAARGQHHRLLHRSHSVSLDSSYLASIASDRQRTAYMQNVYKRYFTQLNAHNLWLFAQSFVKRRTLNLRKDCGAAAHAAAAAAALGTSICTAFVGGVGVPGGGGGTMAAIGPPRGGRGYGVDAAPAAGKCLPLSSSGEQKEQGEALASLRETTRQGLEETRTNSDRIQAKVAGSVAGTRATGKTTATAAASIATTAASTGCSGGGGGKEQQPKALVAGTKVKRTFTCQTLIMCSSVHIHRERALKLMSLLNPLQATWIKTDQLLVLEEKPEKVCQALRLFLQGIGYSMSTYERRLRLGSAQASISSADSNGSARSLNLVAGVDSASSPSQQQQQQKSPADGASSSSASLHHQKTSL